MITQKDLQEAIAECQGQRNPNANTCIKLAAFLTIQKELYGIAEAPTYSYSASPVIQYESESEFADLISGVDINEAMPLFDEMLDAVKVINPKLYNGFMRKLREL